MNLLGLKGKSAEEIAEIFDKRYSELSARRRRVGLFHHVVDHRSSLLKEARTQARRTRHGNFALVFYATYFEHWINGMIWTPAEWRGVPENDVVSLLREAPLRAKLTWVMRLLGLPRLKPDYVKRLLSVAETRNAYVHYKWRPVEKESKKDTDLLRDAEAIARYLGRFENRVVFGGMKRKVLPPIPALKRTVERGFDYVIPRLKE